MQINRGLNSADTLLLQLHVSGQKSTLINLTPIRFKVFVGLCEITALTLQLTGRFRTNSQRQPTLNLLWPFFILVFGLVISELDI